MKKLSRIAAVFFILSLAASYSHCEVSRHLFKNGITLLHKPSQANRIISLALFIKQGSYFEEESKTGLCVMMQGMLKRGTRTKSQKELSEMIDDLGAVISFGAECDYLEGSLTAEKDSFKDSLELFAEIVQKPGFYPEELEKQRKSQLNSLEARKDSIFNTAYDEFNKLIFDGHPYSRMKLGSAGSINSISRDDVIAAHKAFYQPRDTVIVIVGDIDFIKAKKYIDKYFGAMKNTAPPFARGPRLEYSDYDLEVSSKISSEFNQAYLVMGFLAPAVSDEDYAPVKLMNSILGGGMSSRLFSKLREENALAYEVSSFYPSKKDKSAFVLYMGLSAGSIPKASSLMNAETGRLKNEVVPEAELSENKKQMRGSYLMAHQTNQSAGWYLGWWEMLGFGYEYDSRYIQMIENVSAGDIQRAANKYFKGKKSIVTILPKNDK